MITTGEKFAIKLKTMRIPGLFFSGNRFNRRLLLIAAILTLFLFPAFLNAQNSWAVRLGFPEGKKVLLLHIDDAGMCPEANAAAEKYIENGFLTAAAVMMPCPGAASFLEWAKKHPLADIGVHLTLTSEW